MNIWCVKHRESWCACKINRKPNEAGFNVPTKCAHFVVMPLGIAKREPTCLECVEVLK
jgi:hypothetical protein